MIVDNQLGFTTDPADLRSTRYASDLAKGFDIPIVHVNADDPEGCVTAARFAHDYRRTHHRDVVIHLVGYRRFGHNETDEPSYTQPLMYQRIREHPTVRELFVRRLIQEGLITDDEAKEQSDQVFARITEAHKRIKEHLTTLIDEDTSSGRGAARRGRAAGAPHRGRRGRAARRQRGALPGPRRLHRQPQARPPARAAAGRRWEQGGSTGATPRRWRWARCSSTGCRSGSPARTPSAAPSATARWSSTTTRPAAAWAPIQHLEGARATFEVHNSPLSEVGALSFEYGYSAAEPALPGALGGPVRRLRQQRPDGDRPVHRRRPGQVGPALPAGAAPAPRLRGPGTRSTRAPAWNAFSSSRRTATSGSPAARNSAQYFHLLRDQALSPPPRPLVMLTPKSLLRAAETSCAAADLTGGGFRPVIEDPRMADRREAVRVLLLCTGKIAWELEGHELRAHAGDLAIGRVDLLDPLPLDRILEMFRIYPNLEKAFWVQEEPENMGAWAHVQRRIGRHRPYEVSWEYIGRPRRAAPSEGYHGSHVIEQERVLRDGARDLARGPGAPWPARDRPPAAAPEAAPPSAGPCRPAAESLAAPGGPPAVRPVAPASPPRRAGRAAPMSARVVVLGGGPAGDVAALRGAPAGRRRRARGEGRAGRDLPQLGMHSNQITARDRRPAPAHPAGRGPGAQGWARWRWTSPG